MSEPRDTPNIQAGLGWGATAAVALAVCVAVTAVWHLLMPQPSLRVASVNLAKITEEQRRMFAELVTKGDEKKTLEYAAASAQALDRAIATLGSECGCVLLVSDAVVHGTEDMTDRLKEILDETRPRDAGA